jgi:AraC-like DNA-binding protein
MIVASYRSDTGTTSCGFADSADKKNAQLRAVIIMSSPLTHGCQDRRVTRVFDLVCRDLSKRLTQAEAASAAGLRPAYFSKRFQEITGQTFSAWNARIRVDRAKELLMLIDLPITAVAASVGYDDLTTFARVFRKYEGVCPREFRTKRLRNSSQREAGPNLFAV